MFARVILAGTAVAALAATGLTPAVASATSHPTSQPSWHRSTTIAGGRALQGAAVPQLGACLTQQPGATPDFVLSQDFAPPNDPYSSTGADDFTLTAPCNLSSVVVPGTYFNGVGHAQQLQLLITTDGGGVPGSPVLNQTLPAGGFGDSNGTFTIPVSPTLVLAPGTYFISVQAQAVTPLDDWGWETAPQAGYPAVWQNPQDGFYTGCTAWSMMQACANTVDADFAFGLFQPSAGKPCYSQEKKLGKPAARSTVTLRKRTKVDELAADDFKLRTPCKINSVDVPGTYTTGSGPISQVQVTFYNSTVVAGVPQPGTVYNSQTVTAFTDTSGNLSLPLPTTVLAPVGTSWISVQAVTPPNSSVWAWRTVTYLTGYKAVWRSLYNASCTSWTYLATPACANINQPDLAFQLNT